MGQQANMAKNLIVDHQAVTSKYLTVGWQLVQSKNPIVDCLATQTNDQLDTKQEIQWVGISPKTYLDQLVGHPVGPPPPPSEAALPGQPVLSSPETSPLVAHQPVLRPPVVHQPMVRQPVVHQPMVRQPMVHQPSHHIPPLLSLHLQPNLNALA